MQDRFKFRYVFTKDFGGKIGICYKMPIFNLDTITDENFNKIVKSYIDYDYKLISMEQSTGLRDKNGKLIYEGDIISVKIKTQDAFNVEEYYSENYKGEIIFKEGEFAIRVIDTKKQPISLYYYANGCEIIGNIYENPELLEVTNKIKENKEWK